MNPSPLWIAFAGPSQIALGDPKAVAARVKQQADHHPENTLAVFDAITSWPVEIDLRGSIDDVLARLPTTSPDSSPAAAPAQEAPRGPGRPRLGVVAREVTLLPRHWDWLALQSGGASVALRKLVEAAQRASAASDRRRVATESAYRFMHAMAGNEAGFEDASRALFAGDLVRLRREVAAWPPDVRRHLLALAAGAGADDNEGNEGNQTQGQRP
ncbi:MAG: DUF2239 family protein [Pseudomonadota bacterium]